MPSFRKQPGSGVPPGMVADAELTSARIFMREKIFSVILQRHAQPISDHLKQKLRDISNRLERGLFMAAQSKEDYMNLSTLERRISMLIKRPPVNRHNQRPVQVVNSSSSTVTMIPTGHLSNDGHQHETSDFSVSSGGNTSSMVVQRMTGQMIPTPGDDSSNSSIDSC